jgi:hypothetical protein
MATSATTPWPQDNNNKVLCFTWPRSFCFPARDLASATSPKHSLAVAESYLSHLFACPHLAFQHIPKRI